MGALSRLLQGTTIGVPKWWAKSPLSKIIKLDNQIRKSRIRPHVAAAQGKERPMPQKTSVTQQMAIPGAPRANLRLAQGAGTTTRNTRLARGLDTPSSEFPPRSRDPAPRVRFRLARGLGAPSGEFPPRSRPPSTRGTILAPPPGALNAPTHRGRPGQGRVPATPAFWHRLGIRSRCCSANPHCAAIPGAVRVLWGKVSAIPWHSATHSRTSSTSSPSKKDNDTLERGTATDFMLAQDDAVT
jgi:hypothetical protein